MLLKSVFYKEYDCIGYFRYTWMYVEILNFKDHLPGEIYIGSIYPPPLDDFVAGGHLILKNVLTVCAVSRFCVNSEEMMDALTPKSSNVFKSLGVFFVRPN